MNVIFKNLKTSHFFGCLLKECSNKRKIDSRKFLKERARLCFPRRKCSTHPMRVLLLWREMDTGNIVRVSSR